MTEFSLTNAMTFTNELGNEILIRVVYTPSEVTILAVGPTSQVDHTWTWDEAQVIRNLLDHALRCRPTDYESWITSLKEALKK